MDVSGRTPLIIIISCVIGQTVDLMIVTSLVAAERSANRMHCMRLSHVECTEELTTGHRIVISSELRTDLLPWIPTVVVVTDYVFLTVGC